MDDKEILERVGLLWKEVKSIHTTLVCYGAIIDSLLETLYVNGLIDKEEYSENLSNRIDNITQDTYETENEPEVPEMYWGSGGDA